MRGNVITMPLQRGRIGHTAGTGYTGKTWSADKLPSYLENAVQTAVNNYLNAYPELLSN